MSETNEAEVQFVSRRKSAVAYPQSDRASDADAAAANSTATLGFQAHFSFLPGFNLTFFHFIRLFYSEKNPETMIHYGQL